MTLYKNFFERMRDGALAVQNSYCVANQNYQLIIIKSTIR